MRITRLLNPTTWLVGQLICLQAASAQTVTEKTESKPSGLKPSISTSYVRSAADEDSAYYQSLATAKFSLSYTLEDTSSLTLATGVTRNLDALEEYNNWESTALSYSGKAYEVAPDLEFGYSGTITAPTNSEMRDYLSYRGSLGGELGLTRKWQELPFIKSVSAGISGSGTRNFFKYDASQAGTPNTTVALGTGFSAALEVNDAISLSGSYGLTKARKSNDTWVDTLYSHEIAAAIKLTENLSVSVSESNENRAFSYDAQTAQFALYDYQTTLYEIAATYTF
jgi:hypothetical protein